jgi:hypothetical protein
MTKPWSYEHSPCLSHGDCTVPATIMIVRECTGPYAISHHWKKQRFQGFLGSIGTVSTSVRDRTRPYDGSFVNARYGSRNRTESQYPLSRRQNEIDPTSIAQKGNRPALVQITVECRWQAARGERIQTTAHAKKLPENGANPPRYARERPRRSTNI